MIIKLTSRQTRSSSSAGAPKSIGISFRDAVRGENNDIPIYFTPKWFSTGKSHGIKRKAKVSNINRNIIKRFVCEQYHHEANMNIHFIDEANNQLGDDASTDDIRKIGVKFLDATIFEK